jgi:hypothetical protein
VPPHPGHRYPGVAAAATGAASYEQNIADQSYENGNPQALFRVMPEIANYGLAQHFMARDEHSGCKQWRSSSCKDYDKAANLTKPPPPLEINNQDVLMGHGRHGPSNMFPNGTISSSSRKDVFFARALYLLVGLSRCALVYLGYPHTQN